MVAEIEPQTLEIRPQPRQELFLSSPADIAIYGGAAGGGKTWALLLEPLRHIENSRFGAVIFRRTIPEVIKEGGMWDEALGLYPLLGAIPNQNNHQFIFPAGSRVSFAHLQYEIDLQSWKGAQIPLLCFDQLETFTQQQFFYLLSRNRSTSGVVPYVRATCNPEPGWLAEFLSWWIAEDGYADLDRVGRLRWLSREGDSFVWGDSYEELLARNPNAKPKSVTFIVSTIYDNQILMQLDPNYLSNLQSLGYVDRERLLGDAKRGGNWKIKPSAGKVFNREWFEIVDDVPEIGITLRFWDFAATEKKTTSSDPDYTASVKMRRVGGTFFVLHVTNERWAPSVADDNMEKLVESDGYQVIQRWEEESGAAGKRNSYHLTTRLAGYDALGRRPQGDKVMRSKGLAAQALAGNVKLLRGAWNAKFLDEMHGFPDLPHDDIPDAADGAFNELLKPQTKGRSWSG